MRKTFHYKRSLWALAAAFPFIASAAEALVMPPTPPAGVAAKTDGVLAASPVSNLRGTSNTPSPDVPPAPPAPASAGKADLLDVKLPPPPADTTSANLTPTVKPKKVKAVAKTAREDDEVGVKVTASVPKDPFANITATPVSDSQLNRFVFPEKVEGVYFAEGAPLPTCPEEASAQDPCKPVFLNGRRMMLLQLRAGAKGPIQMLVHFASGRVETLNLAPVNGPGAVIRVDGAEDGASDSRLAAAQSTMRAQEGPADKHIGLLSDFAKGAIPAGFETVEIGAPVRFEHFDVVPMAAWSNGNDIKVHLMQVRAHGDTPVVITPGLFRAANIKALALDKETITAREPALLYLVESLVEGN